MTEVWEPAHQIELIMNDCMKMPCFMWLTEYIKNVNTIIETLNIGKGLEQSIASADDVNETFYNLRNLSDTRFTTYFHKTLDSFEKRLNTTVSALNKRQVERDKKVREKAQSLLNIVLSKEFLLLLNGLIDIYEMLGSFSQQFQKVQQFPWEITEKQKELQANLDKMSQLNLSSDSSSFVKENEMWPCLSKNF